MAVERSRPRVVVALFHDREAAENAIRALQAAGFTRESIGVAVRDRSADGILLGDGESRAAEGAATGALSGGVLGGIVGLLVGVGALAIPGIGPVLAGGALAASLGIAGGTAVAGAGIGAATGGVLGALVGLGIPDAEALERQDEDEQQDVRELPVDGADEVARLGRHAAEREPDSAPDLALGPR